MKKGAKKGLLLIVAALLTMLITGCLPDSTVEDLFTLPQAPIEHTDLEKIINELLSSGYEYASPAAGQNIQSVQIVDLNQDGKDEVVAFFRRSSDEKPLKILIFQSREGNYELLLTIESSGTAIERVEYRDMNGDGVQELVVGWQIGTDVQNVAVYALGEKANVLMQSNYFRYSIQELDGDGVPSLMLLRTDTEGSSVAEFYSWHGETMTMAHHCALSSTMAALSGGSVVSGMLDEETPAVFVTGVNEEGIAVTDILLCRDNGTLTNAAINYVTGLSGISYPYRQLQPQDLNQDGIIEIPYSAQPETEKQNDGMVCWMQCDKSGAITRVAETYHCLSKGWYVILPEEWDGEVSAVVTETGINENQVMLRVAGRDVAAVYTITGENRENRALWGNRKVLRRQTDTVYAGEVLANDLGFGDETLRERFHLIMASWAG